MIRFFEVFGWFACIGYASVPPFWLVIHPYVASWRARRRSPYRILLPVWMSMWIFGFAATYPWRRLHFYSTPWTWLPGGALIFLGIFLYVRSRTGFTATQLSGRPELEPGRHAQQLVTTGVRQHVRHPIYLGHLCELLGWFLATGLAVNFALTLFAILTGALMIRTEERELIARFGQSYRDYQQRVPGILPRF